MTEASVTSRRIVLLVAIGLTVLGAAWVWRGAERWRASVSMRKFNTEVDSLFEMFHRYKEHLGEYPRGQNNAQIAKALNGENPKHVILVLKKSDLNVKGEIVDPWGTPLKIYFADNEVLIRSAGPNKRFEDSRATQSDDYFRSD